MTANVPTWQEILYTFHDLEERGEESKREELAKILASLFECSPSSLPHRTQFNLFRFELMDELRALQEEARRVPDEDELIAHGANLEDE